VRWINTVGGIVVGAILLQTPGCTLPEWLSHRPPTSGAPAAVQDSTGGLTVTALPVYRLVTSAALADLPSRLLVIQVRLSTIDDAALSVTPDDVGLALPNGDHAHVFDRARAVEILHRAFLADADFAYLQHNGGTPPVGLSMYVQAPLTDAVVNNLLTEGVLTSEQPLQGYIVVDTGAPMASLDGASLEVSARRLGDSTAVRGTYQFPAQPAASSEAR